MLENNIYRMKANYHTHTTRCYHATGTEREYIENAIKNGFSILGFSDHTPQPFPENYTSRMRMRMDELDEYIEVLQELRKEYEKDITLYIGLEMEYYPAYYEKLYEVLKKKPLDYLILGQHHVPDEITGFYPGDPTRREEHLEKYVDYAIRGMETGIFSYLAHPDLIHYIGADEIYRKHMTRLCKRAKELDMPLEINMYGFERGIQYPCDRFFRLAKEEGCSFIIGCDAHSADGVHQPEQAEGLVEFLNRNEIVPIQELPLRPIK